MKNKHRDTEIREKIEKSHYIVVLEEKAHAHALENKGVKTIKFEDYLKILLE
jgi:hypothetical protein